MTHASQMLLLNLHVFFHAEFNSYVFPISKS